VTNKPTKQIRVAWFANQVQFIVPSSSWDRNR
jgi:hypothetical protein